jgi:predicted Zn-dependent protease
MRLTVASIVAGLLLCSGCATSTKPGAIGIERSQLLIVSPELINEQAASAYASTSSKARSAGKLNSDAALTARVKGISDKLISQVGTFRPDAASWNWEVNVFESDQINAFCYPGGKIGVYTGIITRLNLTDPELAAVIGHEISHALREHSREKASQSQLSNTLAQGLAAYGGRYAGLYGTVASLGSTLFVQLPYSREMEFEADVMGLELMARAGYDPSAASNVWKKMQATAEGSSIEFLSTHPASETRIVALETAVPKVLPLYKPEDVATPSSSAPAATAASAPATSATEQAAPTYPRGESSLTIERLAKAAGCNETPHGGLIEKGPGFERYQVQCTSGTPMMFRCAFRTCKQSEQ